MTEAEALKQRHLAWARARLRSEWGRAQLRKSIEGGFRQLMSTEVSVLFDGVAVNRLADYLASDAFVSKTLRPLIRTSVMLEMARLREDPSKLDTYVSAEAKALVDQLLERPNLMPAKFVEKILAHRAFEDISRDVLDDALREFSEKVDPFRAEWGIPSLLKLGGPIALGLGAFAKAIDSVRSEFQKRLEPERKKFLQSFARRSLNMVADFIIKRNDEPQFIALRKEIFAWMLEQPVSELVATATPQVTELTEKIGHAITRHVNGLDATAKRRRAQLDLFLQAHKKQTLEQALAIYGASINPDFEALTAALWPMVRASMEAPEVDAFFADLIGGFYDQP